MLSSADLYRQGAETLIASWEHYTRSVPGAAMWRLPGVAAAVFPNEPERSLYNNALLARQLAAVERGEAVEAMESAYATAGVTNYAAWVHERDGALRGDLERRGYVLAESTRAMGLDLAAVRLPRPDIDAGPIEWSEFLRVFGLSPALLSGGDHDAFHILGARRDGDIVAAAMAFDLGTDCGIYNVATLPHARRQGLATALSAIHLHDARARGCRTATLQATPMAERVYAAVGFRDLGRILELVGAPVPSSDDDTSSDLSGHQ